MDFLRSYEIYVNGTKVGAVRRNGQLDVDVPCGRVSIEARIDWARSKPLNVETVPGHKLEILVANDWSPLLAIWAVTVGARNYLTLTLRDPQSVA